MLTDPSFSTAPMRSLFILSLIHLGLLANRGLAQERLEPAWSEFDISNFGEPRTSIPKEMEGLVANNPHDLALRYLVPNSFFAPSYVLELSRHHNLLYFRENNYFSDPIVIRKMISDHSVAVLKKLFRAAILSARFPDDLSHWGFDGTYYYFSIMGVGRSLMTATIWSPDRKTNTYELVDICEEIIKQIKSPAGTVEFSEAFTTQIETLTKKFEALR